MATRYSLVIRNGTLVDGTRAPRFEADLGISDGRIVSVGSLKNARADAQIDAMVAQITIVRHQYDIS